MTRIFRRSHKNISKMQREYFENTLGIDPTDGPQDKLVEKMVESGAWCVGTPDDLIDTINRLDEESGGFGGLMIQATEWGTREQVLHSYELIARYVMPKFQGSIENLNRSHSWSVAKIPELKGKRESAFDRARQDYEQSRPK